MLLNKIVDNKEKIDELNKIVAEFNEAKELDGMFVEMTKISDYLVSYSEWLDEDFSEHNISLIEETMLDIEGVFVLSKFSCEYVLENITDYKYKVMESYCGVCDNASQVLDFYYDSDLDKSRNYIICMKPIIKQFQPAKDGWSWDNWGNYIGVQNNTCKYIYDEKEIDMVYCFEIIEILK